MPELYTVEYSVNQSCFHVDTLENAIANNLRNFYFLHQSNDYQILAICQSYEEAQKTVRKFKATPHNSQTKKHSYDEKRMSA